MNGLRQYLLSVICCAVACGIVGSMTEKKQASGGLLKMVTGVFLVFTVISPIASLELEELSVYTEHIREEAASAAAMGEQMQEEFLEERIKSETEAYILDKAAALGTDLTAEVTLGEDLMPESVVLAGEITPYARYRLESIIAEDLAISEENQHWME